MKTVKMHGPSISDPSKIVERDVPENDVVAYQQAGYVVGGLPKEKKAAEEAKAEAEPKAKPTKAKPKAKK